MTALKAETIPCRDPGCWQIFQEHNTDISSVWPYLGFDFDLVGSNLDQLLQSLLAPVHCARDHCAWKMENHTRQNESNVWKSGDESQINATYC